MTKQNRLYAMLSVIGGCIIATLGVIALKNGNTLSGAFMLIVAVIGLFRSWRYLRMSKDAS